MKLAVDHKEPDRVPFDIGGTNLTTIHAAAYRRLREHFGLSSHNVEIMEHLQQVAVVGEDIAEILQTDCRGLYPDPPPTAVQGAQDDENYRTFTDEWGIRHRMPIPAGAYYDMYYHPLADADGIGDLSRYRWPNPLEPSRFGTLQTRCREMRARDKFILLDCMCPGVSEMHAWLRGFEQYYLDLAANQPLAEYIMDRVLELKLAYWDKALSLVGNLIDAVVESDDLGGQDRLLMSPETYRKLIKPRHTLLFSYIKKRAPVKVFYHSDGAIYPLIGDLVESGVDILNPVQWSAKGMDLVRLKRDFGDSIVFWGAGLDTQVASRAREVDIRNDVKRTISILAPGGGFIFAAIHNIQPDVPSSNIIAMLEALREHGDY